MSRKKLSRRTFLGTTLAAAATGAVPPLESSAAVPRSTDNLAERAQGADTLPTTEENIEGPFYRPGVPIRSRLYTDADRGEILLISGTVVARNGRPIVGAEVEVWHANHLGHYDNGDPDHLPPPDEFRWRGRLRTDAQGRYEFETIRPGSYRLTPLEFRAAHIHLKVRARGYRALTSQFFFRGDPHNRTDPWFRPSTVLDLRPDGDNRFRTTYRIVLARA